VEIESEEARAGRTVATLAARARIRELEESSEWTPPRGSRQTARKANAGTQEIIALSTRYGLVSRETSFVAIERRDTPVHGDIQLRRVPIALTNGWGGVDEMLILGAIPARSRRFNMTLGDPAATALPATQARSSLTSWFRVGRSAKSMNEGTASFEFLRRPAVATATEEVAPAGVHALVMLQHA